MSRPPPPNPSGPGRARGRAGAQQQQGGPPGAPPPRGPPPPGQRPMGPPRPPGPPQGQMRPPMPGAPQPRMMPPGQQRPPGPPQGQPRPGGPPQMRRPGPPMPGPGQDAPPPQGQRPGPGQMGPPQQSQSQSSLGGVTPSSSSSDVMGGVGRVAYRADHRGQVSMPAQPQSQSGGGDGSLSQGLQRMSVSGSALGTGAGSGAGTDPGSLGRGVSRGKREVADDILRTRPETLQSKKGDTGQPLKLLTNYFALHVDKDWRLYQYDVKFAPSEECDRVWQKRKLLEQQEKTLGNGYVFDGAMMWSANRYTTPGAGLVLHSQFENGQPCTITITLTKDLYYTDGAFVQFLNKLHGRCLEGLELQQLGRNYFDPKNNIKLPDWKLDLWPGYVSSIRQHEQKMLLCCEISHKILRTDTVLDMLKALYRQYKTGYEQAAQRVLLGVIIITRYNNLSRRIDDIDFNCSPSSTFSRKDGTKVSYADYLMQRYKLRVTDPKQPMLISNPSAAEKRRGNDNPAYLVPEFCCMTGLSDDMRANFKLMKAVGDYTRTGPDKRINSLMHFSKRMHSSQKVQNELKRWNIKMDTNLAPVPGRLLKPEEILQGGGRKCSYSVDNADWGGELRRFKLFNVVECHKWAVIYPRNDADVTKQFLQSLNQVCSGMGFVISAPRSIEIPDNRTATYVNALKPAVEHKIQMVLLILPNNKTDAYHAIKKELCINAAIPSQCVTATVLKKFVQKGLASVASKVAIQMATKLGGEPWSVKLPLKDLMVVGYDSYHDSLAPSKGGRKCSVGAVVSSTNAALTRFASTVSFHYNNEELLLQMKACVVKALRHYKNANAVYPQRVIIFRDGVGDGDIQYVKDSEIAIIKQVFGEAGINPKFTYVVVSKRINTRFFRVNGGPPGNPPSGTIVDDVVTLPERYDFFLISQSVRQGTVNPTSYNVIEDSSGLRPDHIQQLAYKLTHLYYNWPGTVRVPAPCQYAHKLAFLVGQSLHKQPNQELETLLYYL